MSNQCQDCDLLKMDRCKAVSPPRFLASMVLCPIGIWKPTPKQLAKMIAKQEGVIDRMTERRCKPCELKAEAKRLKQLYAASR